jgi:hypothetical protein
MSWYHITLSSGHCSRIFKRSSTFVSGLHLYCWMERHELIVLLFSFWFRDLLHFLLFFHALWLSSRSLCFIRTNRKNSCTFTLDSPTSVTNFFGGNGFTVLCKDESTHAHLAGEHSNRYGISHRWWEHGAALATDNQSQTLAKVRFLEMSRNRAHIALHWHVLWDEEFETPRPNNFSKTGWINTTGESNTSASLMFLVIYLWSR